MISWKILAAHFGYNPKVTQLRSAQKNFRSNQIIKVIVVIERTNRMTHEFHMRVRKKNLLAFIYLSRIRITTFDFVQERDFCVKL